MGKKEDPLEMYNQLINGINNADETIPTYPKSGKSYPYKRFNENDEDSEVFMTSSEKIKEEIKNEETKERSMNPLTGEIEESVVFKRYTKRREHKYTQQEMDAIVESCKRVIVHDYGEKDMYHMSDEERMKHDQLAEIAIKLGGLKRVYRRVDQYIEAMRIIYEAWNILASNNYLHTREEFFDAVASGHIVSNRIIHPKLNKMNRYNIDKIIQYISDPTLDPKDLVPNDEDPNDIFYTQEEYEEEQARLLSPEEIDYIINYDEDESVGIAVKDIKPKYIRDSMVKLSKKEKKKLKKSEKLIRNSLSSLLTKIANGNHYTSRYGFSNSITDDIFKKAKNKSVYDNLVFRGSWSDDTAAEMYDIAIDEEILSERADNERYMTHGDKELQMFYNILEQHGMNTVELRRRISGGQSNTYDAQKQKATRKENKRIENALINRINALSKNDKFKKLVKKAEKKLEEYHKNGNNDSGGTLYFTGIDL